MNRPIDLAGQWAGHFVYGPEFGPEMHGEKVQFRIFVDEFFNGRFKALCVDVEGFESNMDKAVINGFLEEDFISFTKEYPVYFVIDETGKKIKDSSGTKPRLSYEGHYNFRTKIFSGQWELWANEELACEGSVVDIFTGTWQMSKVD